MLKEEHHVKPAKKDITDNHSYLGMTINVQFQSLIISKVFNSVFTWGWTCAKDLIYVLSHVILIKIFIQDQHYKKGMAIECLMMIMIDGHQFKMMRVKDRKSGCNIVVNN